MGLAIIIFIFSCLWIIAGTLTALITGVIAGEVAFITSVTVVFFAWWKSVKSIVRRYQDLALYH